MTEVAWAQGAAEIQDLIDQGRLDVGIIVPTAQIDGDFATAEQRLQSAKTLAATDPSGAYLLMYDGCRIALAAALKKQGLRPTGGEGSHRVVYEAISVQVGPNVTAQIFRPFDRMRRSRNSVSYDSVEVSAQDLTDDLPKAESIITAARTFAARVTTWQPPAGGRTTSSGGGSRTPRRGRTASGTNSGPFRALFLGEGDSDLFH